MMFQGRSVISAVWGVVPASANAPVAGQPGRSVLRLFRRANPASKERAPRLPVASPVSTANRTPGSKS